MPDNISPLDLIPMDVFAPSEPIEIDVVYADADHPENIFGAIYHKNASMILHKDLAKIVIAAARDLYKNCGWTLVLKDGLRTIEAQEKMEHSDIARANPHWFIDGPGRMLAPSGHGAHPRGMAIDVALRDQDGNLVDMGTVFDEMVPASARDCKEFSKTILEHRAILEKAFLDAAQKCDLPILPLPSEWWDFRFPRHYYEQWNPLSDDDLPPFLRMVHPAEQHKNKMMRFDKIAKEVLNSL